MITTLNFNIIFHSMISMETGNQHKILMDVECCLSQNQMCCLCCVYEVHFKTEVKFALHYPDPPSNFVVATCLYFVVTINTPPRARATTASTSWAAPSAPTSTSGRPWGGSWLLAGGSTVDTLIGNNWIKQQGNISIQKDTVLQIWLLPGWSSVWTRTQNI